VRLAVDSGTCVHARRTLSLALDGEAAQSDVVVAVSHIGGCDSCLQFTRNVIAFTRELRTVPVVRLEPPVETRLSREEKR
jgi:predicted anti-sigma-YlaC factor YlaD